MLMVFRKTNGALRRRSFLQCVEYVYAGSNSFNVATSSSSLIGLVT